VTPPLPHTNNNEESSAVIRSITHQQQQKPPALVLCRKKSLMEGILSTLSLLDEYTNFSTSSYRDQQKNHTSTSTDVGDMSQEKQGTTTTANSLSSFTSTWNPLSYTSLNEAIDKVVNNDMQPTSHQLTSLEGEGNHQQARDMMNNNGSNISATTSMNYYNNNAPSRRRKTPSRSASLKVFQRASALKNRPYIWCYRPLHKHEQANANTTAAAEEKSDDSYNSLSSTSASVSLWAAFDVKNQSKLDDHHAFILAKKAHHNQQFISLDVKSNHHRPLHQQQQQGGEIKAENVTYDSALILTLNKQSNTASLVMVSIQDGLVWHYATKNENDAAAAKITNIAYAYLEIVYLPTHYNRLVIFNDILEKNKHEPQIRRSKSMDEFTSNLLNTALKW
jgi:hypothetical protein